MKESFLGVLQTFNQMDIAAQPLYCIRHLAEAFKTKNIFYLTTRGRKFRKYHPWSDTKMQNLMYRRKKNGTEEA